MFLSLILFQNLRRQKQLLVNALDLSRATSEGGMLSCLWGPPFDYTELLWETSVTSMSPNTVLNQLLYALNYMSSIIQILQWFKWISLCIIIRRQLLHICLLLPTMWKKCSEKNIQNINFWTDMAHLVNLKTGFPVATLVITFLSCFFIIIMQHGIIWLQVMERGAFGCLGATIKWSVNEGNHVLYWRDVI